MGNKVSRELGKCGGSSPAEGGRGVNSSTKARLVISRKVFVQLSRGSPSKLTRASNVQRSPSLRTNGFGFSTVSEIPSITYEDDGELESSECGIQSGGYRAYNIEKTRIMKIAVDSVLVCDTK
ncbi:uncharacterized protein LOC125499847 [Athalia rosae]|uniref:uncharacterized protein LOC125499847 n=1 Tax=Athalia rosae TaxID=37344 RepID=UPI00203486AC|nr:uncharacterized protein LOC125499847 [Athalia rosae]